MPNLQRKGLEGEDAAARYLISCGFNITARRYRFGHKEIDLVAERDGLVIFVEVKRRLNEKFGPVETSIDSRKRRNLVAAAEGYIYERGAGGADCRFRFDVILLHPPDNRGQVELEHIEDAFRP